MISGCYSHLPLYITVTMLFILHGGAGVHEQGKEMYYVTF